MRMSDKHAEYRSKNVFRRTLALVLLLCARAAGTAEFRAVAPLQVNSTATLSNTVAITGALAVQNGASPYLNVSGGLTGLGTAAAANVRLDVKGTGTDIQIWRNSGGSEVASMSDSGVLSPAPTPKGSAAPSGTVAFFNGACPADWSELANAQGRYLVGLPSGGTLGGMQGTVLTNTQSRPVGQHGHTLSNNSHTHATVTYRSRPCADACGIACGGPESTMSNNDTGYSNSNVTLSNTDCAGCSTPGTNAPYIQFRVCQKN